MSNSDINSQLSGNNSIIKNVKYTKKFKVVNAARGTGYQELKNLNAKNTNYKEGYSAAHQLYNNENDYMFSFIYKLPKPKNLIIDIVHKDNRSSRTFPIAIRGIGHDIYAIPNEPDVELKNNDNSIATYEVNSEKTEKVATNVIQKEYMDDNSENNYEYINRIRVEYYISSSDKTKFHLIL